VCIFACVMSRLICSMYLCVGVEVFACGSGCRIGRWGMVAIVQPCCGMVCMWNVVVCCGEVACVIGSDGDVG